MRSEFCDYFGTTRDIDFRSSSGYQIFGQILGNGLEILFVYWQFCIITGIKVLFGPFPGISQIFVKKLYRQVLCHNRFNDFQELTIFMIDIFLEVII